MNGYNTKQKTLIEDILRNSVNKHLTVDEIYELLVKQSSGVGRTTVYRTLERLAVSGKVRKYSHGSGSSACFQYIDDPCCHKHFHLKCTECGDIIHLECDSLREISEHISQEHNFSVDYQKTVFYGVCDKCKK